MTACGLLILADQVAGGVPGLRDALLARAAEALGWPPRREEALTAARL